jgi:hypothetical protein
MTAQLPDLKTLNNSRLFTKINNPAEFIKEFRVGDEIIICSSSDNHSFTYLNGVLILEINDLYVKYTNSKQFNLAPYCTKAFECYDRIEDFILVQITWLSRDIFKVRGPTEEDIQKKQDNIREVNDFILEERLRPVNLDEVGISFVGEDYREGKTAFYKNTF